MNIWCLCIFTYFCNTNVMEVSRVTSIVLIELPSSNEEFIVEIKVLKLPASVAFGYNRQCVIKVLVNTPTSVAFGHGRQCLIQGQTKRARVTCKNLRYDCQV